MRARKSLVIFMLAAIVAVILAACGGGGKSGAADTSVSATLGHVAADDPAHMAPANSVLFASAELKPGGANLTNFEAVLNKLGGPGTASSALQQLQASLAKNGPSYKQLFGGWFEGKVGVALNAFPTHSQTQADKLKHVLVIFPTTNPAKARQDLPALLKGSPSDVTGKVVGSYVLVGGTTVVAAAAAAGTDSLAASPGYRTNVEKLPADPAFSVYLRAAALKQLIERNAAQHGGSAAPTMMSSGPKLGANAAGMFNISFAAHAITLDASSYGITQSSTGSSPGVGDLPAGSWVALASGPVSRDQLRNAAFGYFALATASVMVGGEQGKLQGKIRLKPAASFISDTPTAMPDMNAILQRIRKAVDSHITSGIGPVKVSVAGDSLTDLQAGIEVTLAKGQSGTPLLSDIYAMVRRKLPQAQISGTPAQGTFTVQIDGLINVRVSDQSGHVLVTLGYQSDSDFTDPASKLSGTSLYKQAVAALPSGAKPSVLVNFSGFSVLTQLAQFGGGGAQLQQLQSVLGKLNYLTAGAANGDTRIVLALK